MGDHRVFLLFSVQGGAEPENGYILSLTKRQYQPNMLYT